MNLDWFRPRGYKHFDRPVCEKFALKATDPKFVSRHAFSPMIRYIKSEKRYRKTKGAERGKTKYKDRPIMYASHRDACILSYYSFLLGNELNDFYIKRGISENVIAYRPLGRGNYHFAADVFEFAKTNSPVTILAFDVTGFFDNLDHGLLKTRLKRMLNTVSLSDDWLRVFRHISRFHYVELEKLRENPKYAESLKAKGREPIATILDLKASGIAFKPNPTPNVGIPQGTPISATLSNLYMIDFDLAAKAYCDGIGGLYRRYSDDILVICKDEFAAQAEATIGGLVRAEKLELSIAKTERTRFDHTAPAHLPKKAAQYLGFNFHPDGVYIRASSLSRQWRKMKRAFKRTQRVAEEAIAKGRSSKVYTKRLRRRFTPLQFRNFSSYARRSANAFGQGEKISRQLKRFERAVFEKLKLLDTVGED
ncbi:Reverse transcriptase [Siculibacillus lacustris]|uniref:Reverse transcriptase n=1 Tax=Siculibacillus lacustris TaxID=1549641 RepID=A0A4Q9VD79_9HYPH|nr:reverse transcriptase/maturase family protein [Siculibacillus lacustris]TBW32603.1 Reverse transcriptase [Siculibacillus lacustris]